MEPQEPDRGDGALEKRDPFAKNDGPPPDQPGIDVGGFDQGTAFSRWALARYLVGRAVGESVGTSLLVVAVVVLVLAALSQWALHSTLLAVLLVIFALGVLLVRWVLLSVLRRLTAADRYGPVEERLVALVHDTHGDTLRELRRVGLPGRTLTLPLIAVRLIGRRRADTMTKLRAFDIERAVPRARIDELHMILRGELGGGGSGRGSRPGRMDG